MGVRSTNPTQSFIDDFYRSGTDAVTPAPPPQFEASGGTKTTVGSWAFHQFTSSGSLVVSSAPSPKSIYYLVVAGGGAGGSGIIIVRYQV